MATEENLAPPRPEVGQEQVTIGGKTFWADKELIPLLKALNDVGLVTRSHCSGHNHKNAWVAIRTDNVENVEVRMYGEYQEVLLHWRRP